MRAKTFMRPIAGVVEATASLAAAGYGAARH
jgi:hypothetical protein